MRGQGERFDQHSAVTARRPPPRAQRPYSSPQNVLSLQIVATHRSWVWARATLTTDVHRHLLHEPCFVLRRKADKKENPTRISPAILPPSWTIHSLARNAPLDDTSSQKAWGKI